MINKGIKLVSGTMSSYWVKSGFLLSTDTEKPSWDACRDNFQNSYLKSQKKSFFIRPSLPIEHIAKFIFLLEKALNIKPRSFLQQASYVYSIKEKGSKEIKKIAKDALFIDPSVFWHEHPLKISFLTAALKLIDLEDSVDFNRCYSAKSIGEYLLDIDCDFQYFGKTPKAVKRFMAGYCNVHRSSKKTSGWSDTFDVGYYDYPVYSKISKFRVKKILRKEKINLIPAPVFNHENDEIYECKEEDGVVAKSPVDLEQPTLDEAGTWENEAETY